MGNGIKEAHLNRLMELMENLSFSQLNESSLVKSRAKQLNQTWCILKRFHHNFNQNFLSANKDVQCSDDVTSAQLGYENAPLNFSVFTVSMI